MAMTPLPEFNDDITAEILLRVCPDKPAHLSNASLVSKLWHRIVSDPGFIRRYHYFHRRATLLGFFYNLDFPAPLPAFGFDFPAPYSRFVAITGASPLRHGVQDDDRRVSWALDCRHGRVLFKKADSMGLAVWDPIADDWMDLPPPGIQYASYTAVVLCDMADCDHRDCRGGRFLVVCIGQVRHNANRTAYACVYSSEDRAWQPPVTDGTQCWGFDMMRPALIGDGIYCTTAGGYSILKYDLVERRFASIYMPNIFVHASLYWYGRRDPVPVPMQNDDGSLGLVGVRGTRLYIWSTRWNNPEGDASWVQRKVIKLSKLLPLDISNCIKANVIGFAEGIGVCFIRTNAGVFMLHLKSRRVTKVSNPSENYPTVVPFISLVTPDCSP